MSLRVRIEAALRDAGGDHKQAAIEVCRLLEDEIGLEGNGWFDDDDEMRQLLAAPSGASSEAQSVEYWDGLATRLEAALAERLRAAKKGRVGSRCAARALRVHERRACGDDGCWDG